jgi:hypothetical protein
MKINVPEAYAARLPAALATIGLKLSGVINADRVWETKPNDEFPDGCADCGQRAAAKVNGTLYCPQHWLERARADAVL